MTLHELRDGGFLLPGTFDFFMMNLQSNDFELFDAPQCFVQDRVALEARWKALQREVHPDRFAAQGAAAQRVAMQWSVRINEAWQRLRDPLRRAAYLCALHGVPVDAQHNAAMPAAFLLRQMEWHERLDEALLPAEFDAITAELVQQHDLLLALCRQRLDEQHDYVDAAQQVRALMFIERLSSAVNDKRDASVDAMDTGAQRQ